MDDETKNTLQDTLAKLLEQLLKQYGDTPEVRLAIANYTLGYMGATYGLNVG